jgi:hypothetical protein
MMPGFGAPHGGGMPGMGMHGMGGGMGGGMGMPGMGGGMGGGMGMPGMGGGMSMGMGGGMGMPGMGGMGGMGGMNMGGGGHGEFEEDEDDCQYGILEDTIMIPWKGYYVQNGKQNTMDLDDMQISADGKIHCEGGDSVGEFIINGNVMPNGSFNFKKKYIDQHTVSYNGTIRQGALLGHWNFGNQKDEFKITIETEDWEGSFDMDGKTFPMKINLYVSDTGIFGIGKDSEGVFISSGNYDAVDHKLFFTKNYLGKYSIDYDGTMFDDGHYLIVQGRWQLSTGKSGEFELYQQYKEETPKQRDFYMPPPPPENFAPVFHGMPQNQMPQQYQARMGGTAYGQSMPTQGAQMSGVLSDSEFVDGDIEDIHRIGTKLQSGMQITGNQLQRFIPMVQGDDSLLYFCKLLNVNNVKDFSITNLIEALSRYKNQDLNKQTVVLLHPLIRPVPGALENSKMSKLFVFNADRKEVNKALKIDI